MEGKTSETNEITLKASLEKPFSTRKENLTYYKI